MLYAFFRILFRAAIKSYFRRITLVGTENIPASGAVIFAANHSSAVLDPIVMAVLLDRNIHFFARGETFSNAFRRRFFRSLHMYPVYRPETAGDKLNQNRSMYKSAIQLLEQGKAILFFPEATSEAVTWLRPLRSGLSRIALMAADELKSPVKIIPVGINYSNASRHGSNLLLSFGAPISAGDFTSLPHGRAVGALSSAIATGMASNLAGIALPHHHLVEDILSASGNSLQNAAKFAERQQLYPLLSHALSQEPERAELLQWHRSALVRQSRSAGKVFFGMLVLLLPPLWPAAILLWAGYQLAGKFTRREDFRGTMNLVLCTFIIAGSALILFGILILAGSRLWIALLAALWLLVSAWLLPRIVYGLQKQDIHAEIPISAAVDAE